MKQILIIQTASIGDVILATAILEKLHAFHPQVPIDILLKKGNESLFFGHPFIRKILIWDKKHHKKLNLLKLLFRIRSTKYDLVINLQRFFSTGFLTALSGAHQKIGFNKNPLSMFYTKRFPHSIGRKGQPYLHETQRNQLLITHLTDSIAAQPRLYPLPKEYAKVSQYKTHQYICVAPASLWFTKQYPLEEWYNFLSQTSTEVFIYLLGGSADFELCDNLVKKLPGHIVLNFAGKLSLLESAALMRDARMNFVCDSSPMHLASSVDAPTTAVFCSTIPEFGFGPLSKNAIIVQEKEGLACRPCGLHGHWECPMGDFACAHKISTEELINRV